MEEEEGEVPRRGGEEADKEGEISILVEERKADGVTNLGDTPAENHMKFHSNSIQHRNVYSQCIRHKSQDKW